MGNNKSSPGGYLNTFPSNSLRPRHRSSSQLSIHRVINSHPDRGPDVESMGFSFEVAKNIFLRMPLCDLASCMLVCKEWRSVIDTCAFWQAYVERYFDFRHRPPRKGTPLCKWKHNQDCFKMAPVSARKSQNQQAEEDQSPYVFRPFPDVWRCAFVVPHGLVPEKGNLEIYHNFLKALRWCRVMRGKLKQFELANRMEVCLLPWRKPGMPHAQEVVSKFNAHREIIRKGFSGKQLNRDEFGIYYGMLNTKAKGPKFPPGFMQAFLDSIHGMTVVFEGNNEVVSPPPCFIMTQISPGWIGGILYTV